MHQARKAFELVSLIILFLSITLLIVVGFIAKDWMPVREGMDGVIRYLIVTTGAILWRFVGSKTTATPTSVGYARVEIAA